MYATGSHIQSLLLLKMASNESALLLASENQNQRTTPINRNHIASEISTAATTKIDITYNPE